ncbi:MAG: PQQ-binding-like beta-propeller repeat protein [Coriobacteriia bacterium]|nr:PQQ-binding-like beta-propeller repeat protein [Coriobacteriia bacterium]
MGEPGRSRAGQLRTLRLARTASVALLVLAACGWFAWARLAPRPEAVTAKKPVADAGGARIVSGTFLGDAARRTYGGGPAPTGLRQIWKVKIGQGWTRRKSDEKRVLWAGTGWTGQCTMVNDGGRDWLIVGGYDHKLRKLDAATGEVAWEYAFDDVIKGTNTVFVNPRPTSTDDRLIVVAGSRRGSDYAVGDPRIAPLRAVAFGTGRELWRLPVPKTDNYSQDVDASGLLIGRSYYAAVESGYIYRLDPTRTTAWGSFRRPSVIATSPRLYTAADARSHRDTGGANVAIEASPARIGDRLYIASGAGHVFGLSLPNLRVVWDLKTGSDLDGTTVVTRDDKLLVGIEKQYIKGPGGVMLVDPSEPPASSIVWYFPTAERGYSEWLGGIIGSVATNEESIPDGTKPRLASFLSVDGNLYVTAIDTLSSRTAQGPDGRTRYPRPRLVFSERVGGSISTPVIVGDTIVVASSEKSVSLYRIAWTPAAAGDGEALAARDGSLWRVRVTRGASFRTGGPVESTPLVHDGRVYVGCRDGFLYCLGDR